MPIPIKETQDEHTVRKILAKVIAEGADFTVTFSGIVGGVAIFDLTDLKIKNFSIADKIREAIRPKPKK